MKYLLDTHVWMWWTAGSSRIDDSTRRILNDPSNEVILSAASAWEIAIKWRLGRLPLTDSPERYIPLQLSRQGIRSLDIALRHAVATSDLPLYHGDPFDRILVAQARCEGLTLVTADAALAPYPVAQLRV